MPKITARAAVLTAVLALTLTGCAGSADSAGDESTAPETTAPLVAETQQSEEELTDEELFLESVRDELPEDTVIPDATDEQLLAAAQDACGQIAEGTDVLAVQVIEGEEPNGLGYYESSAKIGGLAAEFICP